VPGTIKMHDFRIIRILCVFTATLTRSVRRGNHRFMNVVVMKAASKHRMNGKGDESD
jgi:hypothetical protein